MPTIQTLREEREVIGNEMTKLVDLCKAEDRELTDTERGKWNTDDEDFEKIDKEVKSREEQLALFAKHGERSAEIAKTNPLGVDPDGPRNLDIPERGDGVDTYSQWLGEDQWTIEQLRERIRLPRGYKPYSQWSNLGQCISHGFANPFEWRTRQAKAQGKSLAIQGMNEAIGVDGGFLVLPEFGAKFFERTYSNDLWSRTDNFQVAHNSITFPRNAEASRATGSRHGGLRGYWVAEGGAITGDRPKFGLLSLKLKKLAVVVYLTDELIDDAGIALEQYVTRKVSDEFNFMLGDTVINGTGPGMPKGILNSGATLSITKETGQAAATIVAENIDKMWAGRWGGSTDYAWLINQDIEPQLSGLSQSVGTGGALLYRPPGGLTGDQPSTLKGQPVLTTEFNATLGTVGDIILADLKQYVTIGKGGVQQAQSMHIEFLTDQVALRFILRVDGGTSENTTITPFKGSNNQASFVTLATRA